MNVKKKWRRAASSIMVTLFIIMSWAEPVSAYSMTVAEESTDDSVEQTNCCYINPVYEKIVTEDDLETDSIVLADINGFVDESVTYESNVDTIVTTLQNGMEQREETIHVYYNSDTQPDENMLKGWVEMALEETGKPTQGDYIRLERTKGLG